MCETDNHTLCECAFLIKSVIHYYFQMHINIIYYAQKRLKKIESSIRNINKYISDISFCCRATITVEKQYNDIQKQYNKCILNMLGCKNGTIKHIKYKKEVFELLEKLQNLQESKKQEIEAILEPTEKLKTEYSELALRLNYHQN